MPATVGWVSASWRKVAASRWGVEVTRVTATVSSKSETMTSGASGATTSTLAWALAPRALTAAWCVPGGNGSPGAASTAASNSPSWPENARTVRPRNLTSTSTPGRLEPASVRAVRTAFGPRRPCCSSSTLPAIQATSGRPSPDGRRRAGVPRAAATGGCARRSARARGRVTRRL